MSLELDWYSPSDDNICVLGLAPAVMPGSPQASGYRLSQQQLSVVPEAVATQARFPAGVRLRFYSNTSHLRLTLAVASPSRGAGIDIMVEGNLWRSLLVEPGTVGITVFEGLAAEERLLDIYLPGNQQVHIEQLGIAPDSTLKPAPYKAGLPWVFYGSSIVQGAGSTLSCMNYPAILSRQLNIDTVNFGFYGAGKGEPEVVREVVSVPAHTLVFDLGKSFGKQDAGVYREMLQQACQAQPDAHRVCVTPIFSLREHYDRRFRAFSESLREKFCEAASAVAGTAIIDGMSLLGPNDWGCFSADGLHPNEWGYARIAQRLAAQLQTAASGPA